MTERQTKRESPYTPDEVARLQQNAHKALIEALRSAQQCASPPENIPPELREPLERLGKLNAFDD
jgi:hypothetical protein